MVTKPKYMYVDTETYSDINLMTCGTYKYCEAVEVLTFQYAYDDGEPVVLDFTNGDTLPGEAERYLTDPDVIKVIHNSMFDRNVIYSGMGIDIPVEQIHDTMVQAHLHGLPGALGKLCVILGVPDSEMKLKGGDKLIRMFCTPNPKNYKISRYTRETHPEVWQQFLEYAEWDPIATRAIFKRMPKFNMGIVTDIFSLDQKINDRGYEVDIKLAEQAIDAIRRLKKTLDDEANKLSAGELDSTTKRDKLLQHLETFYGFTPKNLQKATVEALLTNGELHPDVYDLLANRLDSTTSSNAKYRKILQATNSDGRLRGTLQYSGASRTRRWAGRMFQPQNLPRPQFSNETVEQSIGLIKLGCIDFFEPDAGVKIISSCLRGAIVASPRCKLYVSDWSNIEGRDGAWLAGEQWKLDAFRAFDEGSGHDLYKLAYAKSFNVKPESVDKEQRQIGKVQELALQYAGGVGAFVTFASVYGIDLDKLANRVLDNAPSNVVSDAEGFMVWRRDVVGKKALHGLAEDTFIACDTLKRLWRDAHPEIVDTWRGLNDGFIKALRYPNKVFEYKKFKFICQSGWVRIVLPSGASLCYPGAKNTEDGISYMGINQYTRQWERIRTYGGKLFENACQTVARDIMACAMPRAEDAGYNILLTVHDELITEAPDNGQYSEQALSAILSQQPDWCKDMPLAAEGFEDYRYRKD